MQVSLPQNDFLQAVLRQVSKRRTGIKHFGYLDMICHRYVDYEELHVFLKGDLRPSLEVRIRDDRVVHVLVSSTRRKTHGKKLYELQGRRLVGSAEEIAATIRLSAGRIGRIEDSVSSKDVLTEIDDSWRGVSVGVVD